MRAAPARYSPWFSARVRPALMAWAAASLLACAPRTAPPKSVQHAAHPTAADAAPAGGTSAIQQPTSGRIDHSPWLALTIEQDGKPVPLYHYNHGEVIADLARRPFTVRFPTRGPDDVYQVAASADRITLFSAAMVATNHDQFDPKLPPPAYFSEGTGLADTEAGSGTLMMDPEGHNYLIGLRLGPDPARHQWTIRRVGSSVDGDYFESDIAEQREPLHLVVFFDANQDQLIQHGEIELLSLRFGKPI